MIIDVAVEGDDEGIEAASLYQWLANDPDVSSSAGVSLAGQGSQAGQMGVGLDIIQAIFTDGMDFASLGIAVANWRGTRPKQTRVTLKRGDMQITLETDDPDEAARLIERLSAAEESN